MCQEKKVSRAIRWKWAFAALKRALMASVIVTYFFSPTTHFD